MDPIVTRRTLVLVIALFIVGACGGQEGAKTARDAQALLRGLHDAGSFGGAVILSRDGRIVYEGEFGRADRTRSFSLDTPADGASLAKTATAAAIWRLVAAGALALDDPVQRYVAEFPYPDVSIRHLLSHTAGLPDYDPFQPVLEGERPVDNLELQNVMRRQSPRPLFPPGSQFSYCNICYDTLALLIERVTRASYSEHVVKGMLAEAGATTAFLRPARFDDWPGVRTLGFDSSRPDAAVFDVFDNEAIYGGSNIYFSARDLHAWARAWAERRAVPADVWDQALVPARIDGHPSAMTLSSWYCAADRLRCYYTGHHQGFFNLVYWDAARNVTAVFVSNSTIAPPLHPWFMRTLIALAEGGDALPAPAVASDKDTQVDLVAVAGRYRIEGLGEVMIDAAGATPVMQVGDGPRYQLYQVGYGWLYAPGVDAYLTLPLPVGETQPRLSWNSVFLSGDGARISQ